MRLKSADSKTVTKTMGIRILFSVKCKMFFVRKQNFFLPDEVDGEVVEEGSVEQYKGEQNN
jgi:hypothetical protein